LRNHSGSFFVSSPVNVPLGKYHRISGVAAERMAALETVWRKTPQDESPLQKQQAAHCAT
jgi:hypothetical protein